MAARKKGRPTRGVEIDGWRIAARLLRARIAGLGPAVDCDGSCCRFGAWTTVDEHALILKHAARIRQHMDRTQPRWVSEWFAKRPNRDEEFPGGVTYGTRIHRGKCAFRTREGRCSLQATEPELDLPRGTRLKPFACYFFPLTTDGNRIDFDPLIAGHRPCCTVTARGETRALKAWAWELRYLLGRRAFDRVKARLGLAR